ncbi:sugar phosphate isomerase/epimerase [Desulfopila sp. IMCC35008]|uniref:sugar phosphate isomerase/epimerase family protein n=1 Tax=Desulfopila sp. IMCC35008 TaxID=2653858 RepID=UPI0013CF5777|nr:TIM barrel protein [Desulfopila sp. IMCC35008]
MIKDNESKGDRLLLKSMPGNITLAVSTQWHTFPDRFDWLTENGFAMAYTPNALQLELTKQHLEPYLKNGTSVRHHGYFPGFEIGNKDHLLAEKALALHQQSIDALLGLGDQVMTVHVGLIPDIALDHNRVIRNLGRLVEYGNERGVTICLENLRFGPTSNPETMLKWSEESGTSITLDVGHAVSCERVLQGELTVTQIIELFGRMIEEVHFYEYETDTHYAPQDMSVLGPIVDSLLETQCTWWTIELSSYEDILNTRNLIHNHLIESVAKIAA